ncbi:MRPL35 [Candida oxycetoniae]|uniref:Large ribosomal subunit protein mL38 n=1 Tax=Candida oxycetoniae TaxID=497107 RepID=A0AAI9SY31_9ASCO|nr:MRPL35 [Candida oxycetoniae]KAI3404701.1 MRPL35 [Candida oxycetoniae]
MYRRTAIATSRRISSRKQSTSAGGIWSNFKDRSTSLQLKNESIKQGLFQKLDPNKGPASLPTYEQRLEYHSPLEIDETFSMAYKVLEEEAESKYESIRALQKQINESNQKEEDIQSLKDQLDKELVSAEINNPEVLYNVEFNDAEKIDKSQPVYRHLLKQKWESYDLMLLMQRLEQFHVIPDTLPTLVPKADVKIKFTHNTNPEFNHWVEPGQFLPASVVSQPPTIRIQEFDRVEGENNFYSVLLVNPDTPNLDTNSYITTLHYGLYNVPLNNVDNTIDVSKLIKIGPKITFKEYLPLTPEKNAPSQRACLWVFRQSGKIDKNNIVDNYEKDFDIRAFAEEKGLTAVGAHVWRQKYDRSVPAVRKQYGLGQGRVYYKERTHDPVNL